MGEKREERKSGVGCVMNSSFSFLNPLLFFFFPPLFGEAFFLCFELCHELVHSDRVFYNLFSSILVSLAAAKEVSSRLARRTVAHQTILFCFSL